MTQPQPSSDRPQRKIIIQRSSDTPPTQQQVGRGGCFWVLVSFAVLILIVALGMVALVLGGITTLGNLNSGLQAMFTGPAVQPAEVRVTSSQTIVTGIQNMGQLVTIEAQLAKADINVNIQQGVLGASSFTTNHVAQGTISAGVDLTALTADDVQYDAGADRYTITLPPAALTACDVSYIRQYAYTGTILPVDRDEARLLADYTALTEFRDDALESGILIRAEQQAALVLNNFVGSLTGSSVQTIFADAEAPLPPSCTPQIPGEWTYDPATQTWTRPE